MSELPHLEQLLNWSRTQLGAHHLASDDFQRVKETGELPTRHYHTLAHYEFLAQAWDDNPPLPSLNKAKHIDEAQLDTVKALIIRAGAHHDMVYLNADKQQLAPCLTAMLEHFVDKDANGHITTTRDTLPASATPQEHQVFAWAQEIFHKSSANKQGTNEYLSAVYAGLQGLHEGIPPKYILAEMTMIAGTIAFQPAPYFGDLAARFARANAALPATEQATQNEQHAWMQAAVHMANVDVSSFCTLRFHQFRSEHILLLQEACQNDSGLIMKDDAKLKNLYQFLVTLKDDVKDGKRAIFHSYDGFPSTHELKAYHNKAISHIEDTMRFAQQSGS